MPQDTSFENKYSAAVGKKIRQLRKNRGETLEDFADNSGHDASVCGKAERGNSNLTLRSLVDFARALDVEVKDLLPDFEEAGLTALPYDVADDDTPGTRGG